MKFLGSYWSRDGPERDVTRMMLSASKQSWNWPDFDNRDDFIDGRLYSIFGFDHRLHNFWKKLRRRPYVGRKIFEFSEAVSWSNRPESKGKDKPIGGFTIGVLFPWRSR
jgi:hypothetical protein